MSRFAISELPLAGLKLIERKRSGDSRGFLARLFCAEEMREAGFFVPIAQINHTFTEKAGTVRGMHYQSPPHAETKLVICIRGAVRDIAVDLRADSPTFLNWHAEELSAENGRAMLLPEGFAHGFQTLSNEVEMLYCHSAAYNSEAEGGLHPQDPTLAIGWPLPISVLSVRDANRPLLRADFKGMNI